MANTYTQIQLQFVFTPKYRRSVIHSSWEDELYKYITGIVQNNKHKMLCINGMPDHLHMLVGFNTSQSISEFMRVVKSNSSKWINENKFTKIKFEWQLGYGAFSYSTSDVKNVIRYIQNQKEHHRKKSFIDEYKMYLQLFEVDYEERFLFKKLE